MSFRSLSHARFARPVAAGVALLSVTAGITAYRAAGKTVTLSVDGATRSVSLRGDTVRAVLHQAGVTVGSHDLLAPSAGTAVKDGSRVVLRRGRKLTMVVDGTSREVWVTATSVREALGQLDPRFGAGALLSADRSRQIPLKGFSLDVRTRKDVRLVVAGVTHLVATNGLQVADVLRAAHVAVRPADRLSAAPASRIVTGQVISLTRRDLRVLTRDIPIAFGTEQRLDAGTFVGTSTVERLGSAGNLRRVYDLSYVNGKLVRRTMAAERMTSRPVSRVVAVGTRPIPVPVVVPDPVVAVQAAAPASPAAPAPAPVQAAPAPAPAPNPGSSGGLNWGALAACESGGNPRAVSPGGAYRGLYQFDFGTWASVGGSGDPIDASPGEQTNRAEILYSRAGRSPWPVCGAHL